MSPCWPERNVEDECLPEDLVEWLKPSDAETVQQMGWAGVSNGDLLRRAAERSDLFLTADKRWRSQQNLKGRRLAILVLPSNRLKVLRRMVTDIQAALAQVVPGQPDQHSELSQPAE